MFLLREQVRGGLEDGPKVTLPVQSRMHNWSPGLRVQSRGYGCPAPAPGHRRSLGTRTYPTRDPPPPRSPQSLQHSLVRSNPSRVFLHISKFPIHQCQRLCLSKDFLRASQLQRRFNIKDQKPLTNSSMWPSAIPRGLQENQAGAITGSAHRDKPEVSHTVHGHIWLEHLVLMHEARLLIPREVLGSVYSAQIA